MQPEEVAGLQSLARMHGTSLTVNPHTGMPEAFSLGKMFKSLVPMAAGFLLGPAGFGMFSSSLMAGLAVGGLTALTGGSLGESVMAGFGGAGGFGLGEMLKGAGTQVTESLARDQLAKNALEVSKGAATSTPALTNQLANSGQLSMFTRPDVVGSNLLANPNMANVTNVLPDASAFGQIGNSAGTIAQTGGAANLGGAIPGAPKPMGGFGGTFGQNFSQAGKGLDYAMNNPTDFLKTAGGGDMLTGAFKVGAPFAGPILAGMEPEGNNYPTQEKYKYDPYATLNLNDINSGLKLVAKGGYIDSYATGGTVNSNRGTVAGGGLQDLYGASDNTGSPSLSQDGYGIGRLDSLAQQGSLTKAGDMFYAEGGPVSFAEGGEAYPEVTDASNLNKLPTLNLNTGESAVSGGNPLEMLLKSGFKGSIFGPMAGQSALYQSNTAGAAPGGLLSAMKQLVPGGAGIKSPGTLPAGLLGALLTSNPELAKLFGIASPATSSPDTTTSSPAPAPDYNNPIPGVTGALYPTGPDYGAYQPTSYGTYELKKAAKGGYLDGPGDGLSDSIPATIEGKQPARLADGEFVISSDVVSGLGNGSSKAGAKKLYAMMDRVRQQAHGTKKQIRKVNDKQVMPV
jgi:hypothetical protein